MRKYIPALFLAIVLGTAYASTEVGPSSGGGMSVGGAVTGGAVGGPYFGGTAGALSQDATNFFWDDTNNRLGLGTAAPANPLQVVHAGTSGTAVVIQATATSGTGNGMTVQQSKPGQRGVLVQHLATSGAGNAIEASVASGATGRVFSATQSGTGSGILSTISNASSSAIANGGVTNGTGQGVYGEVNGTGTGTGVVAVKTSTSGRAFAVVSGSTASYVSLNAQQTPSFTSYDLTLPNAQGGAGTLLQNDGSGVLSWATPTAPSIGGTLTSATAGSVLFAGSGTFAQDNANLFWDNTNDKLGVGTATPGTKLELYGTGDTSPLLFGSAGSAIRFNDTGQITGAGSTLDLMPNRTMANTGLRLIPYSALGTNDTFMQLFADASAYSYIEAYGGLGLAIGTGTVTPTLFTVNRVEKMRLDTDGDLGIGTSSPTERLDVDGDTMRLRTAKTPASATATCDQGEIVWDADYIYICVATNTWKRTALSTW